MADKKDLVIAALREKLSDEIYANAVLRAEITILINEKEAKNKEAADYIDSLNSK